MNPVLSSDLDLTGADAEPMLDEKQADEVTEITLEDGLDAQVDGAGTVSSAAVIRADDHEAMKNEFFKPNPDYEVLDEVVNTWHIKNWRDQEKRVHGPTFEVGGHPFRVLFFPFGNQPDYTSFYLESAFDGKPPENWYACVQFMLVLSSPTRPSIKITHQATHRYNGEETDWGFTRFAELKKLMTGKWDDSGQPLIVEDAAHMTAYVRVIKDETGVLWHNFMNYDSKTATGMVGLKNQGATCYLNSLLQSLFFTNLFRKAIYQIDTKDVQDPTSDSAYALQRLFYQLDYSQSAVSTTELTTSFGWDSRNIFEQQDVQELSRILMDKMEEKMKGTPFANALSNLFVGNMKTYLECINVDYESSRTEDFWDIQLNVRGNNTLEDSFKDYIQVETLTGDNKYAAEGHGLQDARKGCIFESFPDVLHLQLKRFEYDFQTDNMTKVYDRCEFPETFDATPYLSQTADKSESWVYKLHGVLVHSGDLNAGHYYAFIKPLKDGPFYKFDDDRVTRATNKEAIDENWGGEFGSQANGQVTQQRNPYTKAFTTKRFMSAYMLVYIRESRTDRVLQPLTDADIPTDLAKKITEEQQEAERRRREREEAHLYMSIGFGTDEAFREHEGLDLFPSMTPANADAPGAMRTHRVLKTMTVNDLKKLISAEIGADEDLIRPWYLVGRQNSTLRPDAPAEEGSMRIEDLAGRLGAKLPPRFWVEVASRREDGTPDFTTREQLDQAKNADAQTLLFLKSFDVRNQALKGEGHVFIRKNAKVGELAPVFRKRMNLPENAKLQFFEEIKAKMIDAIADTSSSVSKQELGHGDILVAQEELDEAEVVSLAQAGKYTTAPQYYEFLIARININFSMRNSPEHSGGHFMLTLSKIMSYDQIAQRVAEHLQVDATHLRFSAISTTSTTTRPRQPIKRSPHLTLQSMLSPASSGIYGSGASRPDWLLYEILEMSLAELETRKVLKVTMLSEGVTREETLDLLVPKTGSISDVVPELQKKAKLSDEDAKKIRLYQVEGSKKIRELNGEDTVAGFNEWVTIYAEVIPQEELEAVEGRDTAVYCFHFDKEPFKAHGAPFKFVVKADEVFKDTRERLSKRTGYKGKQLEKIKFAVVPQATSTYARAEYLHDDDVLADKVQTVDDYLGLDHVNKARSMYNKADVMMIR